MFTYLFKALKDNLLRATFSMEQCQYNEKPVEHKSKQTTVDKCSMVFQSFIISHTHSVVVQLLIRIE